jgi:hypothetical protein
MLLVNNTLAFKKSASAMTMGNRKAILLSPGEIQTDILRLPPVPRKQREAAIRRELRSRYPGNTDTADIDWFFLSRNRKGAAAVFTTEPETGLRYREKPGPFIPGMAFLLAGRKTAGNDCNMIVLVTADWLEAVSFVKGEIAEHLAAERKTPPLELLDSITAKTEPVLIILKDTDEADEYIQSLKGYYANNRIIGIPALFREINIRKCAIFSRKKRQRSFPNKKAAVFLALVYGIALLAATVIMAIKTENSITVLERAYHERKAYHDEKEKLLAEINSLENPVPVQDTAVLLDPYALIAEIHRGIRRARVHSIIIQKGQFSFEAEGEDALRLFHNLEASPCFTNITLHQTVPVSFDREQFSVSGRIRYE